MQKLPLRERKKMQTRQRILEAAAKLLEDHDYQAVTIAAICDEADIAPRTFFAYFPSKEAVFFDNKQQLHDYIADKLMNRPIEQTTFQALRELLPSAIDQCFPHNPYSFIIANVNLLQANQQLLMYNQFLSQQFEVMFQQCFARDLHEPIDSLSVQLAAAATNTTMESIMKQENVNRAGATKQDIIKILDKALIFLEGGIATLRKNEHKV